MQPFTRRPLLSFFQRAIIFQFIIYVASETTCQPLHHSASDQLWTHLHPSTLSNVKVSVFPVGSIENHGPHLPFGTDLLLAEAIAHRAVKDIAGVNVLPATPFGASFEHANMPGTIPVHDTALNAVWADIIAGIVASGVRKIILVNAHGGQTQNAELTIRKARFQHNSLVVSFNAQKMLSIAWNRVETCKEKLQEEGPYGIHGGFVETAVMMHLFPQLVKIKERKNFRRRRHFQSALQPHGDVVSFGWRSEDISNDGALGDAASANAEVGSQILNETVQELRALVVELVDTDLKDVLHLSDECSFVERGRQ